MLFVSVLKTMRKSGWLKNALISLYYSNIFNESQERLAVIIVVERGARKGIFSVLREKGIAHGDEGVSCIFFPVELNWGFGSHDKLVRKR